MRRFLLLLLPAILSAQTSVYNRNLIVNGDAEGGPADPNGYDTVSAIPGWTVSGAPDVLTYASGYIVSSGDARPLNSGSNYFGGGRKAANSSLGQTVDISSAAAAIDKGTVTFAASAFMGGWESEPESAQMTLEFLDGTGRSLSSATVSPVTNSDRANTIGLWYRRIVGPVPTGARSTRVTLQFNWVSSNTNDAAADNLSLILNPPADPQSLLGSNLIVNGNAETLGVSDPSLVTGNALDVPGWNRTGLFTIDSYNHVGADLDATTPDPPDRGDYYFYGGSGNPASSASQDIDVSSAASLLDNGSVTFNLAAWLGGYSAQGDSTVLTLTFLNWSGLNLGSVTLGPPSAADRGNVSALLSYSQSGGVPAGTRVIRVQLAMTRTDGGDDDGLADSLSLTLAASGAVGSAPSIGSVVSASAFGGFSAIAPGSWIEIYGSNLAPDTRGWSGADFNGNTAPTSLDGVKVTIGSQAAFVAYVSPGQVNALVPSNVGTGQQTVTVSTGAGSSSPRAVSVNTLQPGLLAPDAFKAGGRQYVFAVLPDGSYAMPTGAVSGLNTKPAHPGDTVTLYGVGFGPVNPDTPAGQLPGGSSDLRMPVEFSVGGAPANVPYKGLAPGLAGVYQFNLVIPATTPGDALPVTFSLAGTPGTQQLVIAVQ